MGINTNQNLPPFLNNTPLTRADIRQLKEAIARLSQDVSGIYRYGDSENLPDRFTIEIFPSIVTGVYRPSGITTPTAQYGMTRVITKDGLTGSDLWKTDPESMPGLKFDFVATNIAELSVDPDPTKDGLPVNNAIPVNRKVLVYALWNRAGGSQSSSSTGGSQAGSLGKLYVFDVYPAAGIPCTLSADGGSNASTSTGYSTYTYTATDYISGTQVGMTLTPLGNRVQGKLTGPATMGTYIFKGKDCKILTTDEQPAIVACP